MDLVAQASACATNCPLQIRGNFSLFGQEHGYKLMSSSVDVPDWSSIPAPVEDGAARHLPGMQLPSVSLPATDGTIIDLSSLRGLLVVYAYPRTGIPGVENPPGWDLIPGARGCTPQTCAFRDRFAELQAVGVSRLFGLSTQSPAYQREFADRLHLPFPILSDEHLELTRALRLPTFETSGMTLLRRLTLVIRDARIERVFYPVFPPDRNASDVLAWLAGKTH
jgi:peroxiredoxin